MPQSVSEILIHATLPYLLTATLAFGATAFGYDPLELPKATPPAPQDLTVQDAARKREIPLRVYLPTSEKPAPVVLFSHGLGGSREGGKYLGAHWAARGYVAVFLQHAGSDTGTWKDAAPAERMAALRAAASARNFLLRVQDVSAVLDQLALWHRAEEHPLKGRLDLERVGMSGHSFGAVTTQAVSGQSFPAGGARIGEARIKAAVAMSPSLPRRATDAKSVFGAVKIPWLLMTGTKDVAVIGDTDVESRLAVFPALPPGRKYEVVLHEAEHSAFSDRALPGESGRRNPNHHRAILALTTAFWDACLKDDAEAKAWLDGEGPRAVLEKEDRWQRK